MNKPRKQQENIAVKRITRISTVSLLLLLILFFAVTLYSTGKLSSQIKLITEHPFAVNGAIGDVKTQLALMRIRTERLQSYNQPADVEKVRQALQDIYEDTDLLIKDTEELYLGPKEDIAALKQTYEKIQSEHESLLLFAGLSDSTTDMIAEYEEKRLYSLYDQFEADAQEILGFVRNTQQSIFTAAEQMSRSTMLWSCIILIAMMAGLLIFQFSIRKMNRKLYDKNRQFEVLSNTIDETFLIFRKDQTRCEFVSGSSERILGIPIDRLKENWKILFQNMDEKTVAQFQEGLNAGDDISREVLLEYHLPESLESRWLRTCFYLVNEEEREKYIVTLTDCTEERRNRTALQDALESARNANLAKRDFLSRMSHEIRTPMNAIIGMTTIAAASIDDRGRVEDCLEKISYSSKHLLMLINDVLDMSRIESNRMKISSEAFDLYQFINTFVSVVYPQAKSKGLKFTEKTTGLFDHMTYIGDPLRLNQILLNLASNAIKFTPEGGTMSLEITRLPSRGKKSWIRFVISDTGIGMDEDALSRLYTPFEQADATIARKYGGSGLGMSIVQNLTALMGGHISVKSKPNEGTKFTVELPFENSDIELQPFQEESLKALEVLVVDDERDICEHTALLLKRLQIHAEWVLSGAQAVERVVEAYEENRHGFDVCFIDWKMPDMDGVETTRRIRESVGQDIPIIIISAYDWSEIEDEARKAGANAFISKPLFQSSIYNALVNITKGAFGITAASLEVKGDYLNGKRFLLAEDNALNQEIAVTLLEMNGAIIETAENGQKALEQFLDTEPGHFDGILMDVQMPVMDGCEATRHIRACGREDAKEIPIIATTANAFSEDVSTVLEAGMNAHISKPIDIQKLCAILGELCI